MALSKSSTPLQRLAGYVAMISSAISIALVAGWMNGKSYDDGYLGGLNWQELIFNWHPILMVSGMVFSFIWAALSFRIFMFGKPINKTLHFCLHSGAIICFSVGLYAVFTGNNDKTKNSEGVYYANLDSLHSWIGISTISLYCLNFVLGFAFFLTNIFSDEWKKAFLTHHISIGTGLLILAGLACVSGIQELVAEMGSCGYELGSADTNPAQHYAEQTEGCRVAYGCGVTILVSVLSAIYAIVDVRSPESQYLEDEKKGLLGSEYSQFR